jgi:hypothetical protein
MQYRDTRLDRDASYVLQLLVTANVLPSSLILITLMIEALRFSETWVLTRATRRHIQEVDIVHSHRCENLINSVALGPRANYTD